MTRLRGAGLATAAVGVLLAVGHFAPTNAPASAPSSVQPPLAKRLRHPTRLAVQPVAGGPASSTAPIRVDPPVEKATNPLVQSDETARLVEALRKAWPNRPSATPRRAAPVPASLPRPRSGDPNAMERAFDKMQVDTEWKRLRAERPSRPRPRLKRLGVQVAKAECRIGACRFELLYSGRAAEERRKKVQSGPRVRATDKTLVHTWADEAGTVRSVIFLARGGKLPLG